MHHYLDWPASVALHPHAAMRYRQQVAELHDAIRAGTSGAREVIDLIRGMIDAIEIKPGPERMELVVVGTLAGFLHRQGDANAMPVVAGMGFGRNHTPIEFLMVG